MCIQYKVLVAKFNQYFTINGDRPIARCLSPLHRFRYLYPCLWHVKGLTSNYEDLAAMKCPNGEIDIT